MPFIWIADEVDGTPVLIKNEQDIEDNMMKNEGFYCVMNLPYRMYLKKEYFMALYGKRYLYKK